MNESFVFTVVMIIVGGLIGYNYGLSKFQPTINELQNIKVEYTKLNQSYMDLRTGYLKLEAERTTLLAERNSLQKQIASYLLEQSAIDFLGLKKYQIAYDLIKISLCSQNPALVICY
ncbi:MAG TPA: hypothetical protein VJB94_02295 [Candidatus Nanoarchaeia archaeon]|nr:hypothetical protein [Candidatus Nanoarchaeia archaeon]